MRIIERLPWTYTWEKGRQLKQMSNTAKTITFDYNHEGLRVRKTVNDTTDGVIVTDYTLHGKNIVHMTRKNSDETINDSLHFFYDASNKPAVVEFNGTKYAYVHDLQGDICQIVDANGTVVVEYTYDAWGKVLDVTGTMASSLGTIQPFRYRGCCGLNPTLQVIKYLLSLNVTEIMCIHSFEAYPNIV